MSEKVNYEERAKQLKDHILNFNDFIVEEVHVPEWELPFSIYIRAMSAQERDDFESRQFIDDVDGKRVFTLENLRASMLIQVICADPEGKYKLFNAEEDVKALGEKSVAAIDRCLEVSRKLNGSTEQDEENLLKNYKGQDEVSG